MKWHLEISNAGKTCKEEHFLTIQGTSTTTNTMYDICAHTSLPISAIIAQSLLKRKEGDEQFCMGGKTLDIWLFTSVFWQS